MKYESTRGGVSQLRFKDAVLMGLASDGGLLIPESIPDVSALLPLWQGLAYPELAFEIVSRFIDDIEPDTLRKLIERSYSSFDDPLVTPLRRLEQFSVLELYHGPTLAFKDVALQFLGNIFELILSEGDSRINILGATSGDTGSAAISGIRGKRNINIFMMFPEGRTSSLQELQMTSVLDSNVHNIAVQGSFDDCQTLMKTIFSDLPFKEAHSLAAVNSVNWTRVLAQIVYYFSAWYQLEMPERFDVAVPTGNFGNVFAGYLARRMGLPIRHLVLATNSNDILHRFFESGVYERGDVNFTHSPAMDIQIASNFERYLYYKLDGQASRVKEFMATFLETGRAELRFNTPSFDNSFRTGEASNEETVETIRALWQQENVIVDPHTAVGIAVAKRHLDASVPMVCLATAHPAKFDQVMQLALPDVNISHPTLEQLKGLETRKTVVPGDYQVIQKLIRSCS